MEDLKPYIALWGQSRQAQLATAAR
jgi:hypothetical protein